MNSGQTAVYTGDFYGHGIVMSHEPLKVNVLYEVVGFRDVRYKINIYRAKTSKKYS